MNLEKLKAKRDSIAYKMVEADEQEYKELEKQLLEIEETIDKYSKVSKKVLEKDKNE